MTFSRLMGVSLFSLIAFAGVGLVVSAQTAPVSHIVVTTQLGSGVAAPAVLPTITVQAQGPSFSTVPDAGTTTLTYLSNFINEVHTVTFVPGNYLVKASAAGYYVAYSPDCGGTTLVGTIDRSCVVTLTTTPPPPNPCTGYLYGCAAPTPYVGSIIPSRLSCSPAYQTVAAGTPATFFAAGGTGGYNWMSADRTSLNIGSTLTTILQSTGIQTVIVSNGAQTATCTVNVTSAGGAIQYPGVAQYPAQYSATAAPLSLVSNYIPALPNTGFEPLSGAAVAFAVVLLLASGILFYPYVRKALVVAVR